MPLTRFAILWRANSGLCRDMHTVGRILQRVRTGGTAPLVADVRGMESRIRGDTSDVGGRRFFYERRPKLCQDLTIRAKIRSPGEFNVGEIEFSQAAQQWVNVVLIWIGFGTLAGLAAKTILPGRDPKGTVATMLLGIVGSTIGLGILSRLVTFSGGSHPMNPISPMGMIAAVIGAFASLIAYRVGIACIMIERNEEPEDV